MKKLSILFWALHLLSGCIKISDDSGCKTPLSVPALNNLYYSDDLGDSLQITVVNHTEGNVYYWYKPDGRRDTTTTANSKVFLSSLELDGDWTVRAGVPGTGCISDAKSVDISIQDNSPGCTISDDYIKAGTANFYMGSSPTFNTLNGYTLEWNNSADLTLHFPRTPAYEYYEVFSFSETAGSPNRNWCTATLVYGGNTYYAVSGKVFTRSNFSQYTIKFCNAVFKRATTGTTVNVSGGFTL